LSRSSARELPLDRSSAAVFAAGVALGVVVGAGVALLMAPKSGYETRRALVRRGRRVSRRGIDAWDDLRDELRQAVRNKRRAWRIKRQRARDAEHSA
jgi:gas vesicle protein